MPTQDKAADYRRRARETRAVAKWISLTDARQKLLEQANRLEALAALDEHGGQQERDFAEAFQTEEDDLLLRAKAAIAEASRLREAHRQILMRTDQQVERLKQIERDLDPLFPHPYWELGMMYRHLFSGV